MSQISSFVKSFVALVKGDDVTVRAEKAFRQATNALKSQISSLEGDSVNLEDAVTDAKEAQKYARINGGEPINDNPGGVNKKKYVSNLLDAKNKVTEAETALEIHTDKIAFLKAELSALETGVEADEVQS